MKGQLKQKRKNKGNAVLQKYKVAVTDFVKRKCGDEEAENNRGFRFVKKKSRKELRKEKRKMKKAKMKSHYEGKTSLQLGDEGHNEKRAERKKKEPTEAQVSEKPESKSTAALQSQSEKINRFQETRKKALLEANEEEDREIKKLERCLRLNRRKNKASLPQSFVADGLDYILGVLHSSSPAAGMNSDDDMDTAKENFEKLEKNDSRMSGEDEEQGDDCESDGSDEYLEDESDDEEMKDDEEEPEENHDGRVQSDTDPSEDVNEEVTKEESEDPQPNTSGSMTGIVSFEIFN